MKHWYSAHTKPNMEHQVSTLLHHSGYETYLPQVLVSDHHQKRAWRPLFPTYLFVAADLTAGVSTDLKWTPGLKYLVSFGEELPVPVPDLAIDSLRHELSRIEVAGGWGVSTAFQPGDKVRITQGPLRDMSAIFDRPLTPDGRVQILLTYLKQVRRVQIDGASLQKVTDKAQQNDRRRRTRGRGRDIAYSSG